MVENTSIPVNQPRAIKFKPKVVEYLQKEKCSGTLIGPMNSNPFGKIAHFPPIDAIPKKDSEDVRIILNLSHPFEAGSVNHAVSKEKYFGLDVDLKYPGIDALVKMIRTKGCGCLLFKRDLKRFYRQIFLCPGSIYLFGFVYMHEFYFDVVLPTGLRIACYIAQRISNVLMYIYKQLSYEGINYLDDLAAAEYARLAKRAFDVLGKILLDLGVWESLAKACEPNTVMVFLGVWFDTINLMLSIVPDRVVALKKELSYWAVGKRATLKEVQSLLGKLNFKAATVRSGRVFLARIINFIKDFKTHQKKLSQELMGDIFWWREFMETYNGVSMIPEIRWCCPDAEISPDSCLSACRGWNKGKYFHARFPIKWLEDPELSIN